MKNAKKKRYIANIASHVFLTVLSIIWLLPVVWLIMQSFRATPTGAFPKAIVPETWTISNYTRLFTETDLFNFPRWFMNTLVVAIASCILTTILTLLTAYAFSRLRFKARKPLMCCSRGRLPPKSQPPGHAILVLPKRPSSAPKR